MGYPPNNNGTKSIKYWNQKTQSWEGEEGEGSETLYPEYACVIYKEDNAKKIVGNVEFAILPKDSHIMITFTSDIDANYQSGVFTFKKCDAIEGAYDTKYFISFEGFTISMNSSTNVKNAKAIEDML